jgi:hypothetical protein
MMSTRLLLDAGDCRLRIRLDPAHAPRTAAALLAALPARIDLHCAKIAGNHILWHAPFVVDAEATSDVMAIPPGGFLYWPERQFLELVFDALQAETAQVTRLGQLETDVETLRVLGRRVQTIQGHAPLLATLRQDDGAAPLAIAVPETREHPALARLVTARQALWDGPPPEIAMLMARRGVMLPAGPLLYAEGYARMLHEMLWRHRAIARNGDHAAAARAGAETLRFAAERIGGFCHLTASAATLQDAADHVRDHPELTLALLDEAILFAGRLAAWLDSRIAWNDLTAATVRAAAEWPDRGDHG